MNFLAKQNPDRWHQLAWWLCVITLPWLDMAFNVSLMLLGVLSITAPGLKERLLSLKSTKWVWPFFIYYVLLVLGTLYTPDVESGLFTLDKKIPFVALPLLAVIGRGLNEQFVSFLKRSFVYSCSALILLCLALAIANLLSGALPYNFDLRGAQGYQALHPGASSVWMHFSYIQLAKGVGMHPAYFSLYLVFSLTILFTEKYSSRSEKVIHLMLTLLISAFTAMLATRMAIIALAISTIYLIIGKVRDRQFSTSLSIFIVVISIGLLVLLNPVARYRLIEEPLKTNYVANASVREWNSVSYRLLEWQGSWSIICDHLFFGVGTSGWKIALTNFYSSYNVSGMMLNSHNQFLQIWMENGILTLIVFLFCVFGFVFRSPVDQGYVAFILIFSLMCMTESILERQKGIVFFTMFQTLFLAFENKSR